jgi:hypothetical protein
MKKPASLPGDMGRMKCNEYADSFASFCHYKRDLVKVEAQLRRRRAVRQIGETEHEFIKGRNLNYGTDEKKKEAIKHLTASRKYIDDELFPDDPEDRQQKTNKALTQTHTHTHRKYE